MVHVEMTCALCKKELKLIKAHAIPEAFFRELRDGWRAPLLVTNTEGHYPKKSPIGVYDDGILCEYCEPSFAEWDDYRASILLRKKNEFAEIKDMSGEVIALKLDRMMVARKCFLRVEGVVILGKTYVYGT